MVQRYSRNESTKDDDPFIDDDAPTTKKRKDKLYGLGGGGEGGSVGTKEIAMNTLSKQLTI